jgi:transposase InsO family protein
MTAELNARGYACTVNTVADLMKAHGLRATTARRFARTTDSRHGLSVAENVLDRDFSPPVLTLPGAPTSRTSRRRTTGCTSPSWWTCSAG